MPELPEVQVTVDGLNKKVLGGTFIDVWSDWEKLVKRPNNFSDFKKQIKGKKIIRVWRRAKNVIFELSEGWSLLIHMKMTGHLMVGVWEKNNGLWVATQNEALKERINGFLHIIFFLDDGRMIALSDVRKFAKIELQLTDHLLELPEFKNLGPEPLEKSFTFKKFQEVFKNLPNGVAGKKGKVKQVIMDPNVIAGVGNIYASEALWWAKINPEKLSGNLNEKELKSLYLAIQKVLNAGINFGGDSFSDYRNVDGQKGSFEGHKKVYQMAGKNCTRCKSVIIRMVIGTRSTFFCPQCQRL